MASVVSDGRWHEETVNRLGKRVFRVTGRSDGPDRVLKVQSAAARGPGVPDLEDERDRLTWLGERLPVPTVVACARNDDDTAFLVLDLVAGDDGVHLGSRVDASRTIPAFGRALAALHALPVAECPFDARVGRRVAQARERAAAGLVDPDVMDAPYRRHGVERLLDLLLDAVPAEEDLVVSHNDWALGNVVVDDGAVVGYLDVGRLGVADRHADLALGIRSVATHISPEAVGPFLVAYGLEWPDGHRLDFYALLRAFF